MKKIISFLLPKKFIHFLSQLKINFKKKSRNSYAQCGEDMILDTIFFDRQKGFYIDVGANNPFIQSNTHYFYKKGWKGINIDALPGSMRHFNRIRPRDINLEIPISNRKETLTYYMFTPSFYNSFSIKQADKYKDYLTGTREIGTELLADVLDKHLGNHTIDFLSIDVENWDLQVLKGNNWKRHRPKVIIVEYFSQLRSNIDGTDLGKYLTDNDYLFLCNTLTNAFFIESSFLKARFPNQEN